MGQASRKLFDAVLGYTEINVVMVGLGGAGKTTILNKLQTDEVFSTDMPTVGFNIGTVQHNNEIFTVRDVGGQMRDRLFWTYNTHEMFGLIFVVDSSDRGTMGMTKERFQDIIEDRSTLNCVILVFANKQDMEGAMTLTEVCEGLGLFELKNRKWYIKGSCALSGDGLYEGLDWLSSTLKEHKAAGFSSLARLSD